MVINTNFLVDDYRYLWFISFLSLQVLSAFPKTGPVKSRMFGLM